MQEIERWRAIAPDEMKERIRRTILANSRVLVLPYAPSIKIAASLNWFHEMKTESLAMAKAVVKAIDDFAEKGFLHADLRYETSLLPKLCHIGVQEMKCAVGSSGGVQEKQVYLLDLTRVQEGVSREEAKQRMLDDLYISEVEVEDLNDGALRGQVEGLSLGDCTPQNLRQTASFGSPLSPPYSDKQLVE